MRRNKYITRHMCKTTVTCMIADTRTGETSELVVGFPRVYKTQTELEAALADAINTDTERFVCVKDIEFDSGTYGISEADFCKHAVKLSE